MKSKYILTNARGYNKGDTTIYNKMIKQVTTISVIEHLRNKLVVGNIYNIREQYKPEGNYLLHRYVGMECIGIYPHMAVFRPVEGRHRFTVAYSYTDLCTGALEGANELMNGILPYGDEEEELEE